MQFDTLQNSFRKRTLLWYGVTVFAAYAVYVFLLVPLYVSVCADVSLSDTFFVYAAGTLYRLLDFGCLCFTYVLLIRLRFSAGKKTALGLLFLYFAASFFKNVGNTVNDWMTAGYDPEDVAFDLLYAFLSFGIEMLFSLLLFIGMNKSTERFCRLEAQSKKDEQLLGKPSPDRRERLLPLPYRQTFGNPPAFGCTLSALLLLVSRLGNRLVYDISFGAPETAVEWLTVLFYYLSDFSVSALYYLFARKVMEKTIL